MRVITFSRVFPAKHPKKGEPTFFMEGILNSLGYNIRTIPIEIRCIINDFAMMEGSCKHHTIRAGNRWKVGDKFSPRVWSGKPYASKQIVIAPDIEIKKIWDIRFHQGEREMMFTLNNETKPIDYRRGKHWNYTIGQIATNDGLSVDDFMSWFEYPNFFEGQILCWNESIEY